MCENGEAAVFRVALSCQSLRSAMDSLGLIHVGVAPGEKRMGNVKGMSYHDTVLNWAGSLVALVTRGIWRAGEAPDIGEQGKFATPERWPQIAESAARSDMIISAEEDVNRVLQLLVEEAVSADRLQKMQLAGLAQVVPVSQAVQASKSSTAATVNARMIDLLNRRTDSRGWTSRQMAEALECSKSAVAETACWRELQKERVQARQDRISRTRRRGE